MSPRDWTPRRRTDIPTAKRRASDLLGHEPAPGGADIPPARRLVELGRRCDLSGRLDEAIGAYEAAIEVAQPNPTDGPILAEALRRLAVILNRRGESETARDMCRRSYEVAAAAGETALRAEALNTLGGLELVRESLDEAHGYLKDALELSGDFPELRGRIEQNLGILCNIRGDRATALGHYHGSLQAFRAAGNQQGCAVAYHNLGMISAHQKQLEAADQYFEQGRKTAQEVGDEHLRGLCLMNRAEVLIALQRFDAAQDTAEKALSIFEALHAPAGIADVQRLLGVVFRETGRLGQAQSRLELAVELAGGTGSPMSHGEALREAARLHSKLGRVDLAVDYLSQACRQFSRVPVVLQGPEVIRGEYPNFVRDWCELVRAVDPQTADHTDRVSVAAVAIAQALGLDAAAQAAIRVAGQLHDVGVLQMPQDILGTSRPLEESEPGLYQTHLAVGAELLATAECFAEVAPIVRYVHQRAGGNGHTGGQGADAVGLGGQVVGLADAYDRLVHGHGSQARLAREEALASLATRDRWHADLHDALVTVTANRTA
jgi:HD-GYP domain-containing protein (c-di-GMP phosphodiesterase class II)